MDEPDVWYWAERFIEAGAVEVGTVEVPAWYAQAEPPSTAAVSAAANLAKRRQVYM